MLHEWLRATTPHHTTPYPLKQMEQTWRAPSQVVHTIQTQHPHFHTILKVKTKTRKWKNLHFSLSKNRNTQRENVTNNGKDGIKKQRKIDNNNNNKMKKKKEGEEKYAISTSARLVSRIHAYT